MWRAALAVSLLLRGAAPVLHYTFIEQATRGGDVILRCAASGDPPPDVIWARDSRPLPADRFKAESSRLAGGDVVSELRMRATPADGGLYQCRAKNRHGEDTHAARLNVYGAPSVRPLGTVKAVAGSDITVLCPYAGYPISSVVWRRRSDESVVGGEGRVRARGAALSLAPASLSDAGAYACEVTAPGGDQARGDLDLQVLNPPKIAPFQFSSELTEGSAAQALCSVSSGDKPLYFTWLKDGAPLPPELQIEEKNLNEFSLLVFPALRARHSGAYTCSVHNRAGGANHTAPLRVLAPPAWRHAPPPSATALLHAPLRLQCAATGHPPPRITWYRWREDDAAGQWELVPAAGGWGGLRAVDGVLQVEEALTQHGARYRCSADNGVGPSLHHHIVLHVHEPARLLEDTDAVRARNVSARRGAAAALQCSARGDAPLAVRWSRGGHALPPRWTPLIERLGALLRSEVRLSVTEPLDAGEYRCVAENPYGRSEAVLVLHVEEPPEAPRDVSLCGVGARWACVTWQSARTSAARPRLQPPYWSAHLTPLDEPAAAPYRINLTALPAEDTEPTLAGWIRLRSEVARLRPAATYALRLTAGDSAAANTVTLRTLEEAPTGIPQNLHVRVSSNEELFLTWSVPPPDTWNGPLLGFVATWDDDGAVGRAVALGAGAGELRLPLRARVALRLRAFNVAGAGPAAPAPTPPAPPPPSPAPPPHCAPLAPGALRVRWQDTPPPLNFHVHYSELSDSEEWSGPVSEARQRGGPGGEVELRGLRAGASYSVRVRGDAGPPSAGVVCVAPPHGPGVVSSLSAAAAGGGALLAAWRPAPGHVTHYTLHVRARDGAGVARAERVWARAARACGELRVAVRGLRAVPHELRVQAHSHQLDGPLSAPATVSPADRAVTRVVSAAVVTRVSRGARASLCCGATGALTRVWRPLPRPNALLHDEDLLIDGVDASAEGNYTCTVRGAGGSDSITQRVVVRPAPRAPAAPRLARRDLTSLHLTWDPPLGMHDDPILGYTVWWSVGGAAGMPARVPGTSRAHTLSSLPCGARTRVTLTAHSRGGTSPHSPPLDAATQGDPPVAPRAQWFVCGNSSALRLNTLAWGAPCPPLLTLAIRPAPATGSLDAGWRALPTDDEFVEVVGLSPGSWYEIRVRARSAAGARDAVYRAATRTDNGEWLGPPELVPQVSPPVASGGAWRGVALIALLAGAAAALLALVAPVALLLARRRATLNVTAPPPREPTDKRLDNVDGPFDISPYATFVMGADGAGMGAGMGATDASCCALHARGRAVSPGLLAAPPPTHLRPSDTRGGRLRARALDRKRASCGGGV